MMEAWKSRVVVQGQSFSAVFLPKEELGIPTTKMKYFLKYFINEFVSPLNRLQWILNKSHDVLK